MSWTPQNLQDSVRRQELYPLYLFHGEETFLIDEALGQLQALAIGDGLRDFNLNVFYGDDAEAARVRDAVETFPMMAPVRMVIVKEAQDLSEKDWEQLFPVLDKPVDTCVFVCVASKIDKRKKAIKKFLESAIVVEFKRPFDNQIPDWVQHIARKNGLALEPGGAELLHQLVGSNLAEIEREVVKLAQFLGERKEAGPDDILNTVSRARLDSVFDLTDAIGRSDRERALGCLANLLENGQNEVGVLSLISRHVRILRLINDGIAQGLSGQRLSARAGVSHFFLKPYVEQSRNWNAAKIDRVFEACLSTDRALKSSPVAGQYWLENLIVETCSA